jgi:cysteine desulfurase
MRIYVDHAASTPMFAEAKSAVEQQLSATGNPSSLHADGRQVKDRIDRAREQCSQAAGCLFGEFYFTSGGTESVVLALAGSALNSPNGRNRVLLGAADHHSVVESQAMLNKLGMQVQFVPANRDGSLDLNALESMIGDDVRLVSVLATNNETGAVTDVNQAAEIAHKSGALLLCDAVQAWPQVLPEADLIVVSAHKMGGPVGVGGLITQNGTKLEPLAAGGGQERELRGGTENAMGIVGFGAAAAEAALRADEISSVKRSAAEHFRDRLDGAAFTLDQASPAGIVHFRYPGISAESLLIRLDHEGVSASSGAACSSGSIEPSHVLMAAGLSEEEAAEGLRVSFGWCSTVGEAEKAAQIISSSAAQIRQV